MLRKRSRAKTTSSNQALMADCGTLQSPTDKYRNPTSFPRLFTGFTLKCLTETEAMMSPTSILDSISFSAFKNPFWPDQPNTPKTPEPVTRHKLDAKGIGLGIVDALNDDQLNTKASNPETRMVLFGSQLRIQIPPLPPSVFSPMESPKSPADFGIKTRDSQLASFPFRLSPTQARNSGSGTSNSGLGTPNSIRVFSGSLSANEMELSEDYTCVISHGPNPKTTHIFDDCIVESCCGVNFSSPFRKENGFLANGSSSYPSESFLSFCYACKKTLGQGKDIYMYRGEKAFCSSECRYQVIMLEEGIDNLESDMFVDPDASLEMHHRSLNSCFKEQTQECSYIFDK
ncbi:DUF581 domain-containing protein [Cephalotus follicularis]|uniref:DUF581 domain-containing protein n=1 Tax=Cephalotus follicularis TaxID=3775 RepID=A0A1Q3DCU3_CEPFO|nr:DUF581 domain-containing protein [Cephalotus follicularis]